MKTVIVALIAGLMVSVSAQADDCELWLRAEKDRGMTAVEFNKKWYADRGMEVPADVAQAADYETKAAEACREKTVKPQDEPVVYESEPNCK